MKRLLPFKAVRYSFKAKAYSTPSISLPYDKIKEEHLKEYRKNPYNISKIILPGGQDIQDYDNANKLYEKFLKSGILRPDTEPSFYTYIIEFEFKGKIYRRNHLIGLLKLPEENENYVFPHEKTFPKTVEDRLKLLRATRANFGLVFLLGKPCPLPRGDLLDSFNLHGEIHKFFRIGNQGDIRKIAECYREAIFVIADGHHRFKTSLIYRNEMREKHGPGGPYDYRMVAITSIDDHGIIILPTHRAAENRIVPDIARKVAAISDLLSILEKVHNSIGIITRDGFYLLEHPDKIPATEYLEKEIFSRNHPGKITYFRTIEEGLNLLKRGARSLFILNPPDVKMIWDYATKGKLLPQKSTDFYPKVATGVTIFDHRSSFVYPEEIFREE